MTTLLGVPQISQTLLDDLDRVGRKYARWTAQAYFELSGSYLVEYCRGNLEILPMPTIAHQRMGSWLFQLLRKAVPPDQGEVLFAGTRVRVSEDVYREPDVLYIPAEWSSFVHDDFTERAGLVMEVVSESNRDHDLTTKRREYAEAGIPEYWIVDAQEQRITVLVLRGQRYIAHGEFTTGQQAVSLVLPRFVVAVTDCFLAAKHRLPSD